MLALVTAARLALGTCSECGVKPDEHPHEGCSLTAQDVQQRIQDFIDGNAVAPPSPVRTEQEIRAQIAEYQQRMQDPKMSKAGSTVLYIRIETLQWVLGEEP